GPGVLQGDLDLLAAGLVEDLPEGGVVAQVEGEGAQGPLGRLLAVVADGGQLALAGVLEDQALEQVVDVRGGEGQLDPGVPLDGALALEVAQAAGEEDDLRQGQGAVRPARPGGCRL